MEPAEPPGPDGNTAVERADSERIVHRASRRILRQEKRNEPASRRKHISRSARSQ